jgi:hypothetical protein
MESQNPKLCTTIVQVDNFTCNTYKVTTCGNNVDPYLPNNSCCGKHSFCASCGKPGCQHEEHSTFLPYTGNQILCRECFSRNSS